MDSPAHSAVVQDGVWDKLKDGYGTCSGKAGGDVSDSMICPATCEDTVRCILQDRARCLQSALVDTEEERKGRLKEKERKRENKNKT